MDSWRQHVQYFVYINLKKRTDRDQEIQHVLKHDLKIPDEFIQRMEAIEALPGSKGCTLSHLAATEKAIESGPAYVCFLEDDFMLHGSAAEFEGRMQDAWEKIHTSGFDKLYLAMTPLKLTPQAGAGQGFVKVNSALGTAGFIVPAKYLPKLRTIYQTALAENIPHDVVMQRFQSQESTYGFFPPIAHQRPGFSDVEQAERDYRALEIDGQMLIATELVPMKPVKKKWLRRSVFD